MNEVPAQYLDLSLQYGALGILGAVLLLGGLPALWWMAKSHVKSMDRIAKACEATVERIDVAERSLHSSIDETRHALRDATQTTQANILAELKEREQRYRRERESERRRLAGKPEPA